MKKLFEILWIRSMKGVGKVRFNRVYADLLTNVNDLDACEALIEKCEPKATNEDILNAKNKAEAALEIINSISGISALTIYDEEYPKSLFALKEKKPPILYVKGSLDYLALPSIAVVGTRKPSEWTSLVEERLVRKIIELEDRVIVSGLALGSDAIAHKAALKAGGKTIAVLPSGVNVITPATNKRIAKDIMETGGCLISEYSPNDIASKSTYVERDAIIAALADSTYVMECAVKSGTMHTVDAAYQMKKPIACYYSNDETKGDYSGNYHAIKTLGAKQVSETGSLISFLSLTGARDNENEQLNLF